jgi:cell division protein FtsL
MAAVAQAPESRRPGRFRPRRRPAARRRVAGGVVWIAVVALLLAGVVAVNVAVLQLNLRLDEAGRQRARLRADNAALASQLARASSVGRIELRAQEQLGLVPADPAETSYVDLER